MEERLLGSEATDVDNLKGRTWIESKKLWRVAFPSMLTKVTSFGILVVTQAFIGHINELDLAAYALIQTITVRFANGILVGMSSATETLCGQAFGAMQYHMLGIYLQRSWIINIATATILVPIFIFGTPIFRLLGQDEDIAKAAGSISLWFVPILYYYVFTLTIQKYLQAQLKNMIVGWLSAGSFFLHLLLSWIFVIKLNLGVPGAMGAMIISSWITVIGEFVYVFGGWCPYTWKGFTLAAFSDIWPVITLSISSGVMLCLELWYNAILVLVAGYMKNAELAISAFSICINIIQWQYMISFGFVGAACVRVSNELGRGNVKAVIFSIKVIICTSMSVGVFFWILCLVFGQKIAYLFTSNEEIAETVSSLSVLLAFSILLNSVQPALSRVAVGAGMQTIVAFVNIGSYYVVGVPIGVLLGYVVDLEIKGIWIGMICGVALQTLVLGYITWGTDWEEQVKKASERLNSIWTPDNLPSFGTTRSNISTKPEDVVVSADLRTSDSRMGSAGVVGSMMHLKTYQNLHAPLTQVTVLTVYVFLYGRLYLVVSGLERAILEDPRIHQTKALEEALATQSVFQLGLLLVLPMVMEIGLERGFCTALGDFIKMQLQLASVFFTFQLGTKTYISLVYSFSYSLLSLDFFMYYFEIFIILI